jgi:hypothetical protein
MTTPRAAAEPNTPPEAPKAAMPPGGKIAIDCYIGNVFSILF